jgi:hypothetical protein
MLKTSVREFDEWKFYNTLSLIDQRYQTRYLLYKMRNKDRTLFENIMDVFYEITSKRCDIVTTGEKSPMPSYIYKIVDNDYIYELFRWRTRIT